MKKIASALAMAQIKMGKAFKQSLNPHLQSKYADLGNVMDACLPALNEAGIAVIQPTGEDENGRFVETIFIHGESDEKLSCRVPLIVAKNNMQGYGSAVTYARRYGLMAMAGIAPEDDDGYAASQGAPQQQQRESAPRQRQTLLERARLNYTREKIPEIISLFHDAKSINELRDIWGLLDKDLQAVAEIVTAKDKAKERLLNSEGDTKAESDESKKLTPKAQTALPYIYAAKNMEDLKLLWDNLPEACRLDPAVIASKDEIKQRFEYLERNNDAESDSEPDVDEIPYEGK